MWLALICNLLVFNLVFTSEVDDYDEIARFNEVRKLGIPLAVLFTEECCNCTDCVEAEVLLGGMSKILEDNLGILVVRLKKTDLRSQYGIKNVPALVYIRVNKDALYDGAFEMESLYEWLEENIEPMTVDLDDQSFEHLTQAATGATTGDWLVIFHDGSCCKNKELIYLENAGIKLRNRVNVANINTKESPVTAQRFRIRQCPSIILFRHQKMYRFTLPDVTATTLIGFSEGFYKNSKAENVPLPQTAFDKFTDEVAERSIRYFNDYYYILLFALAFTSALTASVIVSRMLKPGPEIKKE